MFRGRTAPLFRHTSLILIVLAASALPAFSGEQPWASRDDIDATFDNASSIETHDFDGDGDLDVLAAGEAEGAGSGEISWWENTNGDGSAWTKHIIEGTTVRQTRHAAAADFDGDGDIDVVAITEWFQDILIFLNTDGLGTAWAEVTVDDNVPFTCAAEPADIDGDGDIDIVGGGKRASHVLAWWENDGSAGGWTENTIRANFTGPCAVATADIDKDGLLDVVAGGEFLDQVSWFKNPGSGGGSWTEVVMSSSVIDAVRAVDVGDYDGDGDIDAVAAARAISDLFWFENTGDGATWVEHLVDDDMDDIWDVRSVDIDEDGDEDFVVAARAETPPNPLGAVIVWDNTNGDGSVWTRHDVDGSLSTPQGIWAADVDSDGRMDVLSAASSDRVSWFENESITRNAAWPEERSVDADFNGARSVALADLDCDADLDVIAAGGDGAIIEWWSNSDGDGNTWNFETQIASAFLGAYGVAMGDLDGDGDYDAVATAETGNEVSLFTNTVGDGSAWSESSVDASFTGARGVAIADINGDGALDVVAAAFGDNQFSWWDNTAGDASTFSETSISGAVSATHTGATSVFVADIDGDSDLDVIGGVFTDDDIFFFENMNGDGSTWASFTIDANFDGPTSLWAADIDEDGDLDVVAAGEDGNDIAWFANTAGDGSTWSAAQFIDENGLNGPTAVGVADFDGDGDLDVAATEGLSGGSVVWYANTSGDGSTWSAAQNIENGYDGAAGLAIGDVDHNGLLDVVAAADVDDDVSYFPNLGGQFALTTLDTAPANLGDNITDDLLRITATHNGLAGEADIELTSFELLLEETDGDPLTTNEAMAIIENLFVYLDDGDNTWTGGDTLVTTVPKASISLTVGVQSIAFNDSDVNVQIQQGTPRTYFVVVQTTSNYSTRGLFSLRVTHVTEASSTAEDRSNDTPVRLAWAANTLAGPFDVNPLATPSADLLIESITDDTDPVAQGGTITYTVTVRNDGAWKAENVRVTSTIPGQTTFSSTSGCTEDPNGSPTCTLGDISLLETASFQLTVDVDLAANGTLTYEAAVTSDTDDPASGNDNASENTDVEGDADLAISVGAGPSTYVAGEELTIAIQVENLGPGDDANVLVTDTFPAALQSVTWTCTTLGGASCGNPSGSGDISETVNMPAGSYVTFWATGTVQMGTSGTLSNTAQVAGSTDSNAANDSATVDVEGVAESLFRDGFESGNTSAWTSTFP